MIAPWTGLALRQRRAPQIRGSRLGRGGNPARDQEAPEAHIQRQEKTQAGRPVGSPIGAFLPCSGPGGDPQQRSGLRQPNCAPGGVLRLHDPFRPGLRVVHDGIRTLARHKQCWACTLQTVVLGLHATNSGVGLDVFRVIFFFFFFFCGACCRPRAFFFLK